MLNNTTNRFEFDAEGVIKSDPRHAQIAYAASDRTYLGDVVGWHTGRNPLTGKTDTWLKVRHFNGEAWPFYPRAQDVEVLG